MKPKINRSENKPKSFGRRVTKIVGWIFVVLVLLSAVGLTYQAVSEMRDMRQYLPAGQLIDMGGYRLHLYCTGKGNQTVVLDMT